MAAGRDQAGDAVNDEAVKWLREQITAKLTAARGLAAEGTGHWDAAENGDFDWTVHDVSEVLPKSNPVADCWGEAVAHFIADCDPQDVIARCEAELAILDLYEKQDGLAGENAMEEDRVWVLAPVAGLLASGYRHREGYAEHWGANG